MLFYTHTDLKISSYRNRVRRLTGTKVYADLSFIINLVMDASILWTTARLARLEIKWAKLLAAALVGAVYAVGFLFYPKHICYSLPAKVLFSFFLILLAFYPHSWNDLKKAFLYFYLISFIAAGAITGLPSLVMGMESNIDVLWIVAGLAVALWVGWRGQRLLFDRLIPKILNFLVHIRFDDQEFCGRGFLDTGNMLRDPLTETPVLIAEYQWLRQYLPVDLHTILDSAAEEVYLLDLVTDSIWSGRLRLIPFSSVGRQNGLLLGIRADEIRLDFGEECICRKNLIVAIHREKLSLDGKYQLLIPAEIVQNG